VAGHDPIGEGGIVTRLTAENLTLAYDRRIVARDLDVVIPDGSFTVIIGPNACGKSTLLNAFARLLTPAAGRVLLDGRAISDYRSKEVARRLGLLPQSSTAPGGITVGDLVARGRYPHQKLLRQWSRADEDIVREAMVRTGVLDLCADLNEREGHTLVAVLHDINQACRYATHLIALRPGGIVAAAGRPADVVDADLIEDVFGIRARVMDDPESGTPMIVPLARTSAPSLA
jgi:iron complex transport system ATP-binding protein